MTSLTTTPQPRSPASLSLEVPGKRGIADTHLSWFLQPSSLPSPQVNPPGHGPWPHTLSAAASGFSLWGGVCVCVCVGRGGARHLQPRGGACTPPPGAQTEPASAAADAACLQSRRLAANPEFKAGQEVGKRGRGRQRGWVLRSAEVWAPTPPGGRPAPRPWPADPAPRAPGEGVMGVPPRHRCSRWAGAVQVSRHRPLSVFHSSVRHAGNKHWALLLDLLLYVCTVTDHSSVLAHPPRRHPSHPILVLQERKTGTVESGNVSEAPELASSGVQIQPLRPAKHPQTGRCTEDPPPPS